MRTLAALVSALVVSACVTGQNYTTPEGPRYAGPVPRVAVMPQAHGDTVRVVTFNIQYAVHIDSALSVLENTPELRDPDIVLLQEMDLPGTQRIADALGMSFVYYPSSKRKDTKRDWGNAILSPWPIADDAKLILPHILFVAKTQRIATAATVSVAGKPIRVYSTHLGTVFNVTPGQRKDQLKTILEDAAKYDRVIVGGDMNSGSVGKIATKYGYAWPTKHVARTVKKWRLDHVFFKGFAIPDSAAATVENNRGASDHKPVWARAVLTDEKAPRTTGN